MDDATAAVPNRREFLLRRQPGPGDIPRDHNVLIKPTLKRRRRNSHEVGTESRAQAKRPDAFTSGRPDSFVSG